MMTQDLKCHSLRGTAKKSQIRLQRFIIVGAIVLLMISSLGRLWHVWQVQREVSRLQSQIESAHLVNTQLRRQVETLEGMEYVEKMARDELGLVRPGEITYLTIRNQEDRP